MVEIAGREVRLVRKCPVGEAGLGHEPLRSSGRGHRHCTHAVSPLELLCPCKHGFTRNAIVDAGRPDAHIDRSIGQRLLAHRDPDRHAEQIGIGEFLARTLGPVVQKDVEAAVSTEARRPRRPARAPPPRRRGVRAHGHRMERSSAARRCRARRGAARRRRDDPAGPDPVAPHQHGVLLPVLVQEGRPERRRIGRPELEDVADLDRGLESQPPAAHRAGISFDRLPDVRETGREVAAVLDATQVPARPVCPGDELPFAQGLVGDDLSREPDRAERPRVGAEGGSISSRLTAGTLPSAAASFASSRRSSPRISASTTVPSSFITGIAFDVAAGSMPRNPASSSIVAIPGRRDLGRLSSRSGNVGARGTPCAISSSARSRRSRR